MSVPATLLSTFELLFTPQLPPGVPIPPVVKQIDETVVKAYFLTIANPNSKQYVFQVGFHCNVDPTPTPPASRTLASAVGFIDDGTTAIAATITAGTAVDFVTNVTVAARGTLLLGIIPKFFNSTDFATPVIDCRGWVDITLPALRPKNVLFPVAQSSGPVGVIITPEQRLTFVPVKGDPPTTVEAQSAFALPLVGGSAEVAVSAQPGGLVLEPLAGCGKTPPSVVNNQNVPITACIGQLLKRIFLTISRPLKKIQLLAEAATTRGSFQIDFSAAC